MIIGYTTGVFDMFHIGHLNILKNAKDLCDYLIVGVSTDDLVKNYKSKTPVIPEADRFAIIAGIKHVDKVVYQTTRDKLQAFKQYKFDVMFVGDDWRGNELFQQVENHLSGHGAKVHYFPYTTKVSSTKFQKILQAIENNGNGI